MGLFSFFKSKTSGITASKFNNPQFQMEISALALCKFEENKGDPSLAIRELKKYGLNDQQVEVILGNVKRLLESERGRK